MHFFDNISGEAYDSDATYESEIYEGEKDYGPAESNYRILSLEAIREHQDYTTARVSEVLSISPAEAGVLLRHFKWNADKLYDEWLGYEENVRMAAGLFVKELETGKIMTSSDEEAELLCELCFDTVVKERMKALACGHHYCDVCWRGYIHASITDGSRCLTLRCPYVDPPCRAAVGEDMVFSLAYEEDRIKYKRFLVRSYVEENASIKWCPDPGCEYCAEVVFASGNLGNENEEIICKCSHKYCWNCLQESHRPIDCDTAKSWIAMILNAQIMSHDTRFVHYFELWRANEKFQETASAVLRRTMRSLEIETMSESPDLNFKNRFGITECVKDAWLLVVDCRRVLKWACAYGYYHNGNDNGHAKALFEFIQCEAETLLEKLRYCAENELKDLIDHAEIRPLKDFDNFRIKLKALKKLTRSYFQKQFQAFEENLHKGQILG